MLKAADNLFGSGAPEKSIEEPRQYRPTVVDLFSGAGGTGLGFTEAGFRILGAVELDPNAAETYELNLGVKVTKTDITKLSPRDFREELRLRPGELDVLVGCPPCQGFTRMRNAKGAADARNALVLKYLRFVEEFMPRFAVFENVPGIVRTEHGKEFYEKLCAGLRAREFELVERTVRVTDYGVAQHRERVIVVAGRNREVAPFPLRTHGDPDSVEVWGGYWECQPNVRDVIGNGKYPSLKAGGNGESGGAFPNHVAARTGEKVLSFIAYVPRDGGSREEVPDTHWLKCHLAHDGHKDVYGRVAWGGPANTITSGCTNPSKGRFVHPEQDRALTHREAAALQGFPDWFVFHKKRIAEQIGNAVPPPLARAISEKLRERILATAGPRSQSNGSGHVEDTQDTLGARTGTSDARSPAVRRT